MKLEQHTIGNQQEQRHDGQQCTSSSKRATHIEGLVGCVGR
jgi:hypothetical protein